MIMRSAIRDGPDRPRLGVARLLTGPCRAEDLATAELNIFAIGGKSRSTSDDEIRVSARRTRCRSRAIEVGVGSRENDRACK